MSDSGNTGSKRTRANKLRQREARDRVRRIRTVFGLSLAACALVVAGVGWLLMQPRGGRRHAVKVTVSSGSEGAALEKNGVIRSGLAFDLYCRWHGDYGKFVPGRYALSPTMTLAQIVRQLKLGPGHSPEKNRYRLC